MNTLEPELRLMIKALLFLAALANTGQGSVLIAGAIYYDSENTLLEAQELSRQNDSDGLNRLYIRHHISDRTVDDVAVEVYLRGNTITSPAEFRFLDRPTTYWTLSKFIFDPGPSPSPTPTPTPEATPTPEPTPEKTIRHLPGENTEDVVWHQVDGRWKWYNPRIHHPSESKPKKKPKVLRAQPIENQ